MSLYESLMQELRVLWAVENPDQDNLSGRIAIVKTTLEIKLVERMKEMEKLEEELKLAQQIESVEADIASLESQLATLDDDAPRPASKPRLTLV